MSLLLCLATALPTQTAPPAATVSSGALRGAWVLGGTTAAFKDVPFASLSRFQAPAPAKAWQGTRDATNWGPGCKQHPYGHNPDVPVNQTEDCARLNVFLPASALLAGAKPLPVMVWWHGGAYKEGSSMGPFGLYDGSQIAHEGVVVVSCNYRLDVLGGLVHSGGLTGNYGFLDQRACLAWVRDEIRSFGGDPSNVTAWGQSAGAQSVIFHMTSPGSAGLFHRAIVESSPSLSLFPAKAAAKLGAAVAREVGCKNLTNAAIIACMRAADADILIEAAGKVGGNALDIVATFDIGRATASFLPFKPNIDGIDIIGQPMEVLLSGKAPAAVPALVGFNQDEMWALLSSVPKWIGAPEVRAVLDAWFGSTTSAKAWAHYAPLFPKGDTTSIVVKILTDYLFTCSSQAVAAATASPSFVYQFNHIDSFGVTLWGKFGLTQCEHRACHMTEIPFVFNNKGPTDLNVTFTPAERAISQRMLGAFTNHAKGIAAGWTPYTAANRLGLLINETAVDGPLGVAASVCTEIWDHVGYVHALNPELDPLAKPAQSIAASVSSSCSCCGTGGMIHVSCCRSGQQCDCC